MNETFILLSEEEKNKKLKAVLKRNAGNCLTDDEIRIITTHVSVNRQYVIKTYTEPTEFLTATSVSDGCENRTLLGSVLVGTADLSVAMFREENIAAVITKSMQDGDPIYSLHLYIPSSRLRRGKSYEKI